MKGYMYNDSTETVVPTIVKFPEMDKEWWFPRAEVVRGGG